LPVDGGKNLVMSLAKGFKVLEAFTPQDSELTLTEIGQRAELDSGTVFRLVNTLVMLGYLSRVGDSRRFTLTFKVLDLGFNAIARTELRALARPILRSLVGTVNEAASLAALDGADVVYLERVNAGLVRLGVDIRIGSRLPAYYTTLGISILAHLPRETAIRILNMRERVKLTPKTPTTLEEIEARMERVRREGFIVSDQEVTSGLRILAAPVLDDDGYPSASVSVAAPPTRMPIDEFITLTAGPVMKAAADIGKAIQLSGATLISATGSD
jgi:IclR family pca regulon transcriptional regulator